MHVERTAENSAQVVVEYGDDRLPARLWAKIAYVPDDACWPWTHGRFGYKKGYGAAWYEGFTWRAHRLVFHLLVRPIRDDEHAHHDGCPSTLCCNPNHILALSESEHWGHGHRDKTHCPYGHAYTAANTYRSNGRRHCRTCRAARSR